MTKNIIIKLFYKQRLRSNIWNKFINNLNNYPNICNYLENYYNYFFSYKETLYRIKHNLINENRCDFCNKVIPYKTHGIANFCSKKCRYNYMHKKSKETFIEKYGVDNPLKIDKIKQKVKETNLKKYGQITFTGTPEYKEKLKEHYGVENVYQLEYVKEKIKQTNLKHFDKEYPMQNENIRKKSEETCLKKYGVKYAWNNENAKKTIIKKYGIFPASKRIEAKEYNSKLALERWKNINLSGNFNKPKISKQEEKCYQLLLTKFNENDIIRQYASNSYPFKCDFYIKSLDLYIEYNGSQYHMGHPFNENNDNDLKILNNLKENSKKSIRHQQGKISQYDNMIYTWTILDVRKIKCAKDNDLNYLCFYSIKEFNEWLKKYL